MKKKQAICGVLSGCMFVGQGALGDTVTLEPIKDNTLYESPTGSLSNGAGEHLFAGRNSAPANSRRRAIISFNVAGNVPPGSTIDSVTLTMNASRNSSGSTNIALHRLTADWGEGSSDAGEPGGQGAPATTGDATWLHRLFNAGFWSAAGGDFDPTASAGAAVIGTGYVTWSSTPGLVDDVQMWLNSAATNFGWILIGDEATGGTALRFASRENVAPGNRPALAVEFTPPPQQIPTVSEWGLVVMMLLLITVAKVIFRRRKRHPEPRTLVRANSRRLKPAAQPVYQTSTKGDGT